MAEIVNLGDYANLATACAAVTPPAVIEVDEGSTADPGLASLPAQVKLKGKGRFISELDFSSADPAHAIKLAANVDKSAIEGLSLKGGTSGLGIWLDGDASGGGVRDNRFYDLHLYNFATGIKAEYSWRNHWTSLLMTNCPVGVHLLGNCTTTTFRDFSIGICTTAGFLFEDQCDVILLDGGAIEDCLRCFSAATGTNQAVEVRGVYLEDIDNTGAFYTGQVRIQSCYINGYSAANGTCTIGLLKGEGDCWSAVSNTMRNAPVAILREGSSRRISYMNNKFSDGLTAQINRYSG